MEHKTGLALASAVVVVGGSGVVAWGSFTAAAGSSPADVPVVVAREKAAGDRVARQPRRRKPRIVRITRVVDVPMPAPAGAAPVQPAPAVPAGGDPATHPGASAVAGDDHTEGAVDELIWAFGD